MIDGKTYYAACDVAKAIGFAQSLAAVTNHYGNGTVARLPSQKGLHQCRVITIKDVYRLIMNAVNQNRNLELRKRAEPYAEMLLDVLVDATVKPKHPNKHNKKREA